MPAKLELPPDTPAARSCRRLGLHLRTRRIGADLSVADAARAAGMSRTTWGRIERGSSAVTLGAFASAAAALGLDLAIGPALHAEPAGPATARAAPIRPRDFAQLRELAWQRDPDAELDPQQALQLYERQWRHVDVAALDRNELALIDRLVREHGNGVLLA